jgi:signal transduction histidine kinase
MMNAPPDPNQDGGVLDGPGGWDGPPPATPPAGPARPVFPASLSEAETVQERAERVEVLGALAAGIAHEFNNLLTVVLGSLEQLRRQPLDGQGRRQLERAEWGVWQAGRLSRQVLSFARPQGGAARTVDLNEVLGAFDALLGHAAGDRASLALRLAPQPLPARLDPGQLELAVLNLVRNAADATPAGGSITVRTAGQQVDGLGGQPTVEVSVSDTGTGMAPEVLGRAATAFFTTKEPGRGTGLGLWMVERFAAAWGGRMDIQTAVGQGTTVRLVFPRADPS